MPYVESVHDQIGLAFSIVGLVLVVPSVFLFKQYNRFLDHCQMVLLFWMSLAPTYSVFASHLDESWSNFIPNFLTFCKPGEIVCELGFALSWTICVLGAILLILLIVTLQKCRKPDLRFEPVYSVFKGFLKWTYVPLCYYSGQYLITDIKAGTRDNFLPSVVIVGWCFLFPVIQLIYYKVIQEEKDNIWLKWFEFLGYARQFSIVAIFLLAKLVQVDTTYAKYFVYGPLVLYAVLYLWKGIYINKVLERVIFGIEEAIMITLYSMFLFDPVNLALYDMDFFGLAIILLLNIIYITMRMVNWLVYGQLQQSIVNPELDDEKGKGNESNEALELSGSRNFNPKRKNKFDQANDLLGSRQSLNQSVRRGNQRRRR